MIAQRSGSGACAGLVGAIFAVQHSLDGGKVFLPAAAAPLCAALPRSARLRGRRSYLTRNSDFRLVAIRFRPANSTCYPGGYCMWQLRLKG
jgi:hypothetical protein